MKVHSIPRANFETTRSGFIQIWHHCSVSWKITPLYFCSSNLVYFGQKEPIKVKFSNFWVVGWKFTKSLMSYLKPQVSFSLNFTSLFCVFKDNSSVLFLAETLHDLDKEAHQRAEFQTFDCSREISPNYYFYRVHLLKVYKIAAKKVQRSCLMTLKGDAKFEEKLICCFQNDKIEFVRIGTLIRSVWPK